jgi:Zn-dependent M28 family amino/carboxypeptidase
MRCRGSADRAGTNLYRIGRRLGYGRPMRWSRGVLVALWGVACGGDSSADGSAGSDTGSSEADADVSVDDDGPGPGSVDDDNTDPDTSPDDDSSDDDAADESSTGDGPVVDCDDLPAAITADGMRVHLEALAQIATDNGGNRAVGTPGFDASADYVRAQLEDVGYTASMQSFDVDVFVVGGPSTLEWQGEVAWTEGTDYQVAPYSGAGSVTTTASVVDLDLGPGNGSTSGCEGGDFAGFDAGDIAVIQRGECFLSQKVLNAQAAGASGVVLFNQGNTEDRMGMWVATLGAETNVEIPVVLTTYAVGEGIAQAGGSVTIALEVDAGVETRSTANVIIESAGGDANDVLMLGAHLDSVPAGPGINDNGSGSAALLEVARALQACETTRKVRFAWWGAEEVGLVGSGIYVDSLDQMQRDAIALYMNFDMIGSPNWVRFRYDGDGSAFGDPGPMGSAELEQVFADWFDGMGLETEETAFDGRSDYGPFVAAGIASGGLATGAEGTKSPLQAEVYGGVAGEPYDACYHAACDGEDNVDLEILEAMGGAIAHAVTLYALP